VVRYRQEVCHACAGGNADRSGCRQCGGTGFVDIRILTDAEIKALDRALRDSSEFLYSIK